VCIISFKLLVNLNPRLILQIQYVRIPTTTKRYSMNCHLHRDPSYPFTSLYDISSLKEWITFSTFLIFELDTKSFHPPPDVGPKILVPKAPHWLFCPQPYPWWPILEESFLFQLCNPGLCTWFRIVVLVVFIAH